VIHDGMPYDYCSAGTVSTVLGKMKKL